MSRFRFRMARVQDAAPLLAIYGYYVENTVISFETQTPPLAEFEKRIQDICLNYPYLVCEQNERIVGYAYANRHKERAAYQWNAELSAYLHQDYTGAGIGKALCKALIALSELQNLRNLYGVVATPNPASEKMQLKLGFKKEGLMEKTGFKLGTWHDIATYHKRIGGNDAPPAPFVPAPALDPEKVAEILEASAASLRGG